MKKSSAGDSRFHVLGLRLPKKLVAEIEDLRQLHAKEAGMLVSRTQMIRALLTEAIRARKG